MSSLSHTLNVKQRLWCCALVVACLFLPATAWGQEGPDFGKLANFIRWGGVFASLIVVLATAVLLRIITTVAERMGVRFSNRRLTIQKIESFARFLIYIASGALVVSLSIRLDPAVLTLLGASLGFAIGFAMRDLVAAFIAGVTIMFDRPFQVGDRVQYAGEYGDIVEIGLRSVRMNTLDHNIVTIPNNKVLTDVTSSGNYGALEMQVGMDFYVGLDQDLQVASDLIEEACITSRYCFLDQPVPIGIKLVQLQDILAYHIKARPYVLDVKYEKAFETDVHKSVQKAFMNAKVHPPAILHRTLAE